ncbi:MAG: hypothetical protein AAFR64_03860 [Pseudomonadota bacterium]
MAFTDRPSTEKVLGGVFLAVILGWAIRFVLAGGVIEYFDSNKRIENEIAAALSKEPGTESVLRRLESDFPDKYDEFLATLSNRLNQDQSANRVAPTAVTWIRSFFASHENDFGFAPMPQLDAVIDWEQQFIAKLADENVASCDAYAIGLPLEEQPSLEVRELGAKAVEARFDAIRAGRKDQQMRLKLNPTDFEAVAVSLAEKGATRDQIEFAFGDLNGAVLDEGVPCKSLQMLLETIIEQPEERRALLIGAYASQG